jgi:hypothetical protein
LGHGRPSESVWPDRRPEGFKDGGFAGGGVAHPPVARSFEHLNAALTGAAGSLAGSGERWGVGHAGAVGEGDGEVAVGGVEAELPAAFVYEVMVTAT